MISTMQYLGGIYGEKSQDYEGLAYMFTVGERVSIGASESDDIFVMNSARKSLCFVAYDLVNSEYQVMPKEKCAVFLDSGQALGSNRIYCIPRGRSLKFSENNSIFKLL